MLERREERRRFIEAIESLLPELSGLVEDARRTITELQKAATDIARAVERLTERSAAGAEKEPNYGELLCAEILAYWRIGENWSKTTALMMLEALADSGKGNLAQWGAAELLKGETITLSRNGKDASYYRLTQLARDGTALKPRKQDRKARAEAQGDVGVDATAPHGNRASSEGPRLPDPESAPPRFPISGGPDESG